MKSGIINIKTHDGDCDSFFAHPDDGKSYPAILFFMDAFGPREYLYEMAKKLASNGYYVLLPNVFYRERHAPITDAKFPIKTDEEKAEIFKQIFSLMKNFSVQKVVDDVEFFLNFFDSQKEIISGKIGAVGYCLGGGIAIRSAAQFPNRIAAAASFHGGKLATEASDSPHLLLNKIKAELYIAHADNDQSMSAEQIELLENALKKSGLKYEAEIYRGAEHGFTMADLPSYNEAALKLHWNKLLNLFNRALRN